MKTLRFVLVALVATLLGVNFTSCTKEGDPQYNLVKNEKKLTQFGWTGYIYGSETRMFTYDNEGRLQDVTHNNGEDSYTSTYVWENDKIGDCILSNGLITKYGTWELTYNDKQRLSEIKSSDIYQDSYQIKWHNNGGLSQISTIQCSDPVGNPTSKRTSEFLNFYNGEDISTCKGFNPIVSFLIGNICYLGENLCFVHPELVGARTNILPNKYERESFYLAEDGRYKSVREQGSCSYIFDDDGYVTECIMSDPSYGETKFTMVWE